MPNNGEEMGLLPFDDGSMGRIMRKEWHDGRWFFSVIDAVAILTDSTNPGTYWRVLKHRLSAEGASEVVTKCNKLKMRAIDGKKYATDAADTETMLRIVQSIPSPKAEPFKQWLAKVGAQKLDEAAAALPEQQKRLLLRGEIATQNTSLNAAASAMGVLSGRDFSVFHDSGYRGLYAGMSARDIAAHKGVKPGKILDHMGSTEMAYNLFRVSLADDKLRQMADEGITGKEIANQTHYTVGREVRATIERVGGTMPEDLPVAPSIQQIEQAEEKRVKGQLQPSLFGDDVSEGDE
jgi:DNA-damage-inducible protein D